MSRAQGRRVAGRPPHQEATAQGRPGPRAGALLAVLVVVLTVATLVAAGAVGRAAGTRPAVSSRPDVGERSFVCTGGLPGTRAVAGTAGSRGSVTVDGRSRQAATFAVPRPLHVLADPESAADAYAAEGAATARWLAAAACPEPRPGWWFVGAGATDGHDTVLTVANPRPGSAIFDVDVFGPHGLVDAPGLHGLTLASGRTRTLDLARVAPATGDLAVRVRTSRGLVSVGAAESWSPALIGKQVREWVAPQPAPSREVNLTGLSGGGSSSLVVANPGEREAVVHLRLVGKNGTYQPTSHASVTISPGEVSDVDVSDVVRPGTAAILLEANVPVVATLRSVHGNDEAYAAATGPLRGTAVVGVPPVGRAGIVLVSVPPTQDASPGRQARQPARGARAELRILGKGGRQLGSRTAAVPASGSATVPLRRGTRAVAVSASGGDVVATVVLRSGPGIATLPVASSLTQQRRPGVLPAW